MDTFYWLLLLLLAATAGWLAYRQLRGQSQRTTGHQREARLEELAGFGQAILNAQLQLDALCEVVYQQASRIIDTTNFQLGLFDDADYVIMIWLRGGVRLESRRFSRAANEGLIGWVRRTGQGLLIRDYEKEWDSLPARPSYQAQPTYRSAIFAPLVAGGDTIGVIAVQSETPGAYADSDLRLLMVLTNQAAGAIRNAQLFEQTQARNRQLQLVNEVSQQVTAMQPLPDLFRQIVTLLQQTFKYYMVNIFALDEKKGLLTLQASSHPALYERLPQIQLGTGLIGWAAERASTALAPDVTRDHRYFEVATLDETRAEIAVPLIVERRVVGVLDVQSDQIGAFNQEDVVMLETLASQIALAVQEAETYAAERRQRERLNALTEASRAVVSILDLDELLEEVIDLLTDYFGYDRTHIFLREGDRIIFRAGSGVHSGRWAIEHLAYDINDPGIITKCIRTQQPIICNDVSQYPDYVPGPGVEDTQAEMAIPIRMSMQTLGVLDIQSKERDAFSPDDAALAEALADTMAIALRNAALYSREKRRRILAESLREISMTLGASLEVDRVLDGILQGLERVIDVAVAIIILYDDVEEAYRISAVRGHAQAESLLGQVIAPEADIQAEIVRIFHTDGTVDDAADDDHLVIPLTIGEESIGYLAVDYRAGRLSADDLEMINAFATQSAMAIANAHLYMAQREEAWVSTALLQVAEATARADTLDEVLLTVARITPMLVGVEWCAVLLEEPEGFRIVAVEGTSPEIEALYVGQAISPGSWEPLSRMLATQEAVMLDHTTPPPPIDSAPARLAEASARQIGQGVMLPLYARGEIVGAMLIGQQSGEEVLSRRKIEMVSGIANQAALAIESAQLSAARQEEAWVTTALLQVAEAVNAQVELTSTLQTIVRLTPLLVGVRCCVVLRRDERNDSFFGAIAYGLPQAAEEALAAAVFTPAEHPYLQALAVAAAPLPAGPGYEQRVPAELQHLLGVADVLGLPLTAQGRLVGVMLVDHPNPGGIIDQRRMNILTGIAWQTAMAIENGRLQELAAERQRLERDLEVAQSIQTSFLPDSTPSVPGWEVAAHYRAARMVGGDFYDFLPLSDGKWGLVVADVADKGMPAALYMALSRTLLRAVARNQDDPATTLLRVNRLLLEDTHSDLFVTMWYAIWNPADGTLQYSSAGHNPPFVLRSRNQSVEMLKLKGIALGVLPNIHLEAGIVTLEPGDLLVLYTDGITEAQNAAGVQFGLGGLLEATRVHSQQNASEIADAVIAALDAHTGDAPRFDDLTLVIIQRQAQATE